MDQKELQELIGRARGEPAAMLRVGISYLEGEVLCDAVAAEAWLWKAAQCGNRPEAAEAMALLGRRIWHREQIIPEEDCRQIRKEWERAEGEEKEYLEALLKAAGPDKGR